MEDSDMKLALCLPLIAASAILAAPAALADDGGNIGPREARVIRHEAHEYRQMQRWAHADGQVTRAERARLQHKQREVRRLIHRARNN
jgi:hypothetical protein